jgi:hypothetical protein
MSGTFATSAIVIKLITDEYDRRTLEQGEALPAAACQKKRARSAMFGGFNCHRKGHVTA